MNKEWLIQRFEALRKERGWSKCKLSEEAGFPSGMIYQWYNSKRMPSVQNIEMICKACHITLSEFFATDEKEKELLCDVNFNKLYRELSFAEKKFILGVAEDLIKLKETNG